MSKDKKPTSSSSEEQENAFPGYPHYPDSEDIYRKDKEETELDPEDPSKIKIPNDPSEKTNEINLDEELTGDDLDIPGSELDDEQENIGSEDEENNYYSLGGDNHSDLDESQD